MELNSVRILAIGPHPDDVESTVAGTLALAARAGAAGIIACPPIVLEIPHAAGAGLLDIADPRLDEAREAAQLLGAAFDLLPLAPFMDDATACTALVALLRRHQPHILLVNHADDAHPFHAQIGRWAIDACFLAQLATVVTEDAPWSVAQIYRYRAFSCRSFIPDTYIDITTTMALARRALRCHRTGLAMLPGLVHWADTMRVQAGLQIARPYAEGLQRVGGVHWEHLPNRQFGARFVVALNDLALQEN